MAIVDAHHHLFGTAEDANFYRLSDLEQDLGSGHRIIGTVYVEGYASGWRQIGPELLKPIGEIEMIVNQAEASRSACQIAAGIVTHVDLSSGDGVAAVLNAAVEAGKGRLRGVRDIPARDDGLVGRFIKKIPRAHMLGDPAFRRGFAQLQRFGLSYDVWIYHHQFDELFDLVDAFPNTPIVLDHVGGLIGVGEYAADRRSVFAGWERNMRALAQRSSVCVKIGGLGMPVFGFGFEHEDRTATSAELAQAWQPLIDVCVDAFGPSRCMFESNFPVDSQSCGYVELWNAYKLATRTLAADERRDMFYRTACRTYRMPDLQAIGDQALTT
jgi:predicted TIM-barrel fold metal-dependent hydrolase